MPTTKTTGTDGVLRAMQTYTIQYRSACVGILEDEAEIIKERMQNEHKWENRTGAAEAGLDCQVFDAGGFKIRLVAFHGVPYGRFLETMQGGKFAVLLPTMRSEWPRVLARLRRTTAGLRNAGQQPPT